MKSVLISVFLVLFSLSAAAENAVHIRGHDCGLFDADGGFVLTNDTKTTFTFSKNGNVIMKCRTKGLENSTGKAVIIDYETTGLLCGTFGGATEDWKETVSASGNATLICRFKDLDLE